MIRTSESTKLVTNALAEFHKREVSVPKTAENPFFKSKYADLWTIKFQCEPHLNTLGLVVIQMPGVSEGGKPTLITRLSHSSGEFMEAETPLYLSKDDPQAQGSAITYMRRYAYCALLGIVADPDDDANAATKPKKKPQSDYQEANGEMIPFPEAGETTSVRTGPGGVDMTPLNEAQQKKAYAIVKGHWGQEAKVNEVLTVLFERPIKHTSNLGVNELDRLTNLVKVQS